MKNIRKDEANEKQPQIKRVGTVDGSPLVRVYFNHSEEERENFSDEDGNTHTVYLADYIQRKSNQTDAVAVLQEELLEQIDSYDTSPAVNSFQLQGKQMWLPKETRVGLVNSITIEKAAGKDTTTLWFDGEKYVLPIDDALQMLSALELYALECYNTTAAHKAQVLTLSDVSSIVSYDIAEGYPEKLDF
ncbi:MAG: DUF4376 domain-containing protein [Prevotella sp.]